jgi:hypothetical protein
MALAGNGIPDLTRPPLCLMEMNFWHQLELRPFLAAIIIKPLIQRIDCSKLARPDIVSSIAPLVLTNPNLKIVDLHRCSAQSGIPEPRPPQRVEQARVTAFCASLVATRADVFYFNLSNTSLSANADRIRNS